MRGQWLNSPLVEFSSIPALPAAARPLLPVDGVGIFCSMLISSGSGPPVDNLLTSAAEPLTSTVKAMYCVGSRHCTACVAVYVASVDIES